VETNNAMLLDVREPGEWDLGTLPEALRISMGDIPGRLDDLTGKDGVLVVCRSGARSQQVAVYLSMNGVTNVANLAGGMKALGLQD